MTATKGNIEIKEYFYAWTGEKFIGTDKYHHEKYILSYPSEIMSREEALQVLQDCKNRFIEEKKAALSKKNNP